MGLQIIPQCRMLVNKEVSGDPITVHTHTAGVCAIWKGVFPHEHHDRAIFVAKAQIPDLVEALWRAVDYKVIPGINGNPEDFKRLSHNEWAAVRGVLFHVDRLLESTEFGTQQHEALMRLKAEFPA